MYIMRERESPEIKGDLATTKRDSSQESLNIATNSVRVYIHIYIYMKNERERQEIKGISVSLVD